MKSIFLIAAITVGCTSASILCMLSSIEKNKISAREANRIILVCQQNGQPISGNTIKNFHPAQSKLVRKYNQWHIAQQQTK